MCARNLPPARKKTKKSSLIHDTENRNRCKTETVVSSLRNKRPDLLPWQERPRKNIRSHSWDLFRSTYMQCAKRRHRSSVDKTENPLFVREHSENLFLAVFTYTKKAKNTTKHDETQASFVHFFSFVREHTDFWCSRTKKCP